MSELGTHFRVNHPAMFNKDSQAKISLYATTDKSATFYGLLDKIAPCLNYIVVAAGDDETNITIAINVLEYIRRKRKDLKKLRILVRAYGQESFSHLAGIASHYNKVLGDESNKQKVITIFGQIDEIFTYGIIVENLFKRKAIFFYESYDAAFVLTEEGQSYGGKRTNWQERRKKALSSNKLSDIEDLRRKEYQDYSNAWHALTKQRITELILVEYCRSSFNMQLATRMFNQEFDSPVREISPTEISYPKLDNQFEESFEPIISKLITNLAKTEHIRWIASHEALGYEFKAKQDTKTKDIIHKWHSCMVPWEELELLPKSSTRLYDYLVIETTLKLIEKPEQRSAS